MKIRISLHLLGVALIIASSFACSHRRTSLDNYVEDQKQKIIKKEVRNQGELDFWVAAMEVNLEEIDNFRGAWLEHGQSVPESKDVKRIMEAVEDPKNRVILVSLFRSNYDDADLKNKLQGWGVFPTPALTTELSEYDVPLRTIMPVENQWARYFMLVYRAESWLSSPKLVISNLNNKVEIKPE